MKISNVSLQSGETKQIWTVYFESGVSPFKKKRDIT